MGKHERDWVEIAEKAVADGLNGILVDVPIKKIVDKLTAHISSLYPDDSISSAEWSGGDSYDDPGDVVVYLRSGDIVNVELKFSHGRGSGTAKNPGPKFFTKRISPTILSYTDFEQGYKLQRLDYLSGITGVKFRNYSHYITELRKIRDQADRGDEPSAQVISTIAGITNPGQEAYASYAAEKLNGFLDEINAVAIELLGLDDSGPEIRQGTVYCVIKRFESDRQTVEFYDYSEMDRQITKVIATGQSIKFLNASGRDVFRFAVNWKNVCQGGATPSFNVWVGRAFQ